MIFWSIRTLRMRDNHGSGLLVGRYVNYLSPPALWSSSLWGEKSLIPTWQRDRLDMFFALPQIVLNTRVISNVKLDNRSHYSFLLWTTLKTLPEFSEWGMVPIFMRYSWIYRSYECMLHLCWPHLWFVMVVDYTSKVVFWSFWSREDFLFPKC